MRLCALWLCTALVCSACLVRFVEPDDDSPAPPEVHQAQPVQPVQGRPPPPVAPAPVVMSREEAAHAALGHAQAQGYGAQLKKVKWHKGRYWRVDVDVWRADGKGRMRLDYDAYSRVLAHAQVRVHERQHGHEEDDDDD